MAKKKTQPRAKSKRVRKEKPQIKKKAKRVARKPAAKAKSVKKPAPQKLAVRKAAEKKRKKIVSKLRAVIKKREKAKKAIVTKVTMKPEKEKERVSKVKAPRVKKLKKAELEKIRQALLEEKARILEQIKRLEKLSATDGSFRTADELPHHSMHIAEFASDNQAIDAAIGLRNIEEEHLAQIIESLEKLDRGEYGLCESCGKPIDPERLMALPFTKLCLACKRNMELSGGL
ncbi:MAG: TraR/DksA C4-type zinc finger protein [Candidatus Sumerlaeia bacterium]|nr:TraR/DksA C4-type zinc finger protein [Candidatus Sumerlaeia bacterium]